MKRRSFLKNSASAAILTGVAGCSQASSSAENSVSPSPPGTGPYFHQGRIEGYKEFRIIDPGRKITKIETFSRENIAVVRVSTDDGHSGWGQISTYNSDIVSMILHRNLAQKVLGKDPVLIDQISDQSTKKI